MQMPAIVMSALFAAIGAMSVFWPDIVLDFARNLVTPNGLFAAAAVRVVFGAALLVAAGTSRAPNLLRVFGLVIFVAGLATPLFGADRAHALLDALSADRGAWMRIVGTLALAFGCIFVWALSPRQMTPQRR
jgi:hypothetical protein